MKKFWRDVSVVVVGYIIAKDLRNILIREVNRLLIRLTKLEK